MKPAQPPKGKYDDFVEHPRYGRTPRFTYLELKAAPPGYQLGTTLASVMIEGTAVAADLERQSFSIFPVLYYFDLKMICHDCDRPFIFFAEEQKYWYETLGFSLDAMCLRCVPCRKRCQGLERQRRRYEELIHLENRSSDDNLEMAECCLALLEAKIFHHRQTERVRMLLNRIPPEREEALDQRYQTIYQRLLDYESGGRK